ncbi:hypothetical protein [uncultured Microbulbifer sp.]|uniref:hypothetical protein n=1 Tax=uncultured Microbulbifer sp. TaxID=348147 RepID=UPI002617BA75|nr:hypothetical protein [uncultured Microbulbifer sp.]
MNTLINIDELRDYIQSDIALKWVKSLISRYSETPESLDFITLKKGITKEVLDELLPLSKYAQSYYNDPKVFLKFYPGSTTSYDADFIDSEGKLLERKEVTVAIDGQQSTIQAESIVEFGHSPIYHTPEYCGNVKNRTINETDGDIVGTDSIIDLQSERIQRAYRKKHENLHKYPNTTLLIGADIPLFMEWEYQAIIDKFEVLEDTFNSIKCVNISSNHCWILKLI